MQKTRCANCEEEIETEFVIKQIQNINGYREFCSVRCFIKYHE